MHKGGFGRVGQSLPWVALLSRHSRQLSQRESRVVRSDGAGERFVTERNVRMKIPKILIGYVMACIVVLLTILALPGSLTDALDYYGFALDSRGNLYLGLNSEINVLDPDGNVIRTVSPTTSRGYCFTIVDDKLLISTGTSLSVLDLAGNLLAEHTPADGTARFSETHFVDGSGNEYVMRAPWLRTGVYDKTNGMDCIWQMPLYAYISRLLGVCLFVSWFVFLPIILVRWRKLNPPTKWW